MPASCPLEPYLSDGEERIVRRDSRPCHRSIPSVTRYPMRRLCSALLTVAVAAVVLVNPVGRAEARSSAPYAQLSCGQGQVFTSAPSVTANQGTAQNPH